MMTRKKKIHVVTFQVTDTDRNEMLCDECYQEWLQGIKGKVSSGIFPTLL
ncbi:hypothetical protein ACXM0N_07090 [Peribacillus simplex]